MFRIMCNEYVSFTLVFPVQYGKVVVGHGIAVKCGDRCVEIACIENNQHVIDQVVNVDPYSCVLYRFAVLILPLKGVVISV